MSREKVKLTPERIKEMLVKAQDAAIKAQSKVYQLENELAEKDGQWIPRQPEPWEEK